VAAVELRLDGREIAMLDRAPWTAEVDLGRELAPHRLTAVARAATGAEIARTEQWINLPQPRSQVELLPDAVGGEPPRSVRVIWRSVDGGRPDSASLTFDGVPIEVGGLERVELPVYDPKRIHLLKAELRFGPSLAHAEILIGGTTGETVGSELTAFPVLLAPRQKPPGPAEMAGWFERGGRSLRVVAVDRGPADIILVQDQSPRILGQLERLRQEALEAPLTTRRPTPGPAGIQHGDRLRVIVPFALPVARQPAGAGVASDDPTPLELFPISADLAVPSRAPTSIGIGQRRVAGPRATGLLAALFYQAPPAGLPQRLADAVAEAGRAAAAGGRPRAVVLVTGPESTDASRFSPRAARAYLRRLRVPLRVWSTGALPEGSGWGPVSRIGSSSRLTRALREARTTLHRQLVVWLEGRHLPQEIELTAAAAQTLQPVSSRRPEPSS
jgi:hypothetical protein